MLNSPSYPEKAAMLRTVSRTSSSDTVNRMVSTTRSSTARETSSFRVRIGNPLLLASACENSPFDNRRSISTLRLYSFKKS